ncbi:hypothetical protein HCUR_00898 [Holospora curviuscula]|uniref:Uncharacterized protein n=1 Tax=Holospora curviuscula TaxID=1082868 RepID=A0A2S5R8K1_9PROT|nr:hypothetical protein HCUR_00898 [Holospora curviuscula]
MKNLPEQLFTLKSGWYFSSMREFAPIRNLIKNFFRFRNVNLYLFSVIFFDTKTYGCFFLTVTYLDKVYEWFS